MAVVQVTYLCVGTLEDLDPIIHALSFMKWSCGFWVHFMTDIYVVNRKLRPVEMTHSFLDNYNILSLLIFVPAIAALVIFLVNKWKYGSSN